MSIYFNLKENETTTTTNTNTIHTKRQFPSKKITTKTGSTQINEHLIFQSQHFFRNLYQKQYKTKPFQ